MDRGGQPPPGGRDDRGEGGVNLLDWAIRLQGRDIDTPRVITHQESDQAKAEGIVIVWGESDDLMEFRGAIYEELGAYNGTTALVTSKGLLRRPEHCELDDDDMAACPYLKAEMDKAAKIKIRWNDNPRGDDPYAWVVSTDIPHEKFSLYTSEEGTPQPWCLGIVFRLEDVKAPASIEDRVRALIAEWRKIGSFESNRSADELEEALK